MHWLKTVSTSAASIDCGAYAKETNVAMEPATMIAVPTYHSCFQGGGRVWIAGS